MVLFSCASLVNNVIRNRDETHSIHYESYNKNNLYQPIVQNKSRQKEFTDILLLNHCFCTLCVLLLRTGDVAIGSPSFSVRSEQATFSDRLGRWHMNLVYSARTVVLAFIIHQISANLLAQAELIELTSLHEFTWLVKQPVSAKSWRKV